MPEPSPALSTFHRVALAELARELRPDHAVLELGSTEFSFRPHLPATRSWRTADMFPPADIVQNFDDPFVRLPLADAELDVVVCTDVLEHLHFATAFLDELFRVLCPNGLLLVGVPNNTSLTQRVASAIGHSSASDLAVDDSNVKDHERYVSDYTPARLRAMLDQKGFAVERLRGSGLHRRRQIAPAWLVPAHLSSALIAVARRRPEFATTPVRAVTEDRPMPVLQAVARPLTFRTRTD